MYIHTYKYVCVCVLVCVSFALFMLPIWFLLLHAFDNPTQKRHEYLAHSSRLAEYKQNLVVHVSDEA